MQAELVKQDAIPATCVLDQLVVGNDLNISISTGQCLEIPLTINGRVIVHLHLEPKTRCYICNQISKVPDANGIYRSPINIVCLALFDFNKSLNYLLRRIGPVIVSAGALKFDDDNSAS